MWLGEGMGGHLASGCVCTGDGGGSVQTPHVSAPIVGGVNMSHHRREGGQRRTGHKRLQVTCWLTAAVGIIHRDCSCKASDPPVTNGSKSTMSIFNSLIADPYLATTPQPPHTPARRHTLYHCTGIRWATNRTVLCGSFLAGALPAQQSPPCRRPPALVPACSVPPPCLCCLLRSLCYTPSDRPSLSLCRGPARRPRRGNLLIVIRTTIAARRPRDGGALRGACSLTSVSPGPPGRRQRLEPNMC